MRGLADLTVLIVEDGDEYVHSLGAHVLGPRYIQAHSAAEALEVLSTEAVDLLYLDMRFDRTPIDTLVGDRERLMGQFFGDSTRVNQHLQNNQGLYVLKAVENAGFGAIPVIMAYDFSRESKRLARLQEQHQQLSWVRDTVGADQIAAEMIRLSTTRL